MSARAEEALVGLWKSVGGPATGVALACVGSLARGELGPRSDLDLVLLHDGRPVGVDGGLDGLSERLWYPLWDARVKMDHSVRTPAECTAVAVREVSAGVGLLDLRVVAGDGALVGSARTALLTAWRTNARRRLPELLESLDDRWSKAGDAAYLLEPDLKEARGGLRDMTMLRALAATWLTDRPHVGVEVPHERLLDVRDALHVSSGRDLDRLLAGEVDEVAGILGFTEPDDLRREVSLGARRVAHAVDLTVRAARQALPSRRVLSFVRRARRPEYRIAEHGLIVSGGSGGEVGLARVETADDPLTGLRAGALAAREGLTLSPVTAENLGARVSPLPDPWPEAARDALLTMLASGAHLLPVWEALDLAGCITCWLPEWTAVRARPQHNPVHRHTVDRHSVQTVVEAQRFLTDVDRPDLLLLAALLHDIGKLPGAGPDHPAVGAPIARAVADRIGLLSADAGVVERLVREHLTLAELATRRDHADPKTQETLVAAVDGRSDVLALLRRLTEADARAAGPAAWSPWRASLINALADQVESLLIDGRPVGRADLSRLVDLGLARSVALDGRARVRVEPRAGGAQLMVAAPDRLGLFSDTAGLLAAAGVQVRAAVLHTVEGVAVNTWRVDKERVVDVPDAAYLTTQLERLAAGDRAALEPVRRRESRARPEPAHVQVEAVGDASESATVLEVRTGDRPGLLWALGASLSGAGLSIRSAHASTLAGQAIDTFYVTEPDGRRPAAERDREALAALTGAARAGSTATH